MATKSILKNVNIKSNSSARNLAYALEQSKHKSADIVVQSKAHDYIDKNDIKEIFTSDKK